MVVQMTDAQKYLWERVKGTLRKDVDKSVSRPDAPKDISGNSFWMSVRFTPVGASNAASSVN